MRKTLPSTGARTSTQQDASARPTVVDLGWRDQHGAGRLQFEALDAKRRLGGIEGRFAGLHLQLRAVQGSLGDGTTPGQRFGPLQLGGSELQLRSGPGDLGLGQGAGCFGRLHRRLRLLFAANVEERRFGRLNRDQYGLAGGNLVPHIALDPQGQARDRRGNDVDIRYSGVAFVVHRDGKRAARNLGDVDRYGLRPKGIGERARHRQDHGACRCHTACMRRHDRLLPGFQHSYKVEPAHAPANDEA